MPIDHTWIHGLFVVKLVAMTVLIERCLLPALLVGYASSWTVSPRASAPAMNAAEEAPVPAGARLSVRAFIQRSSHAHVDHMIAFPIKTWVIVLIGQLLLATTSSWGCVRGENVHGTWIISCA